MSRPPSAPAVALLLAAALAFGAAVPAARAEDGIGGAAGQEPTPRRFLLGGGLRSGGAEDDLFISLTVEYGDLLGRGLGLLWRTEAGYTFIPGVLQAREGGPLFSQEVALAVPGLLLPRLSAVLDGAIRFGTRAGYRLFSPRAQVALRYAATPSLTLSLAYHLQVHEASDVDPALLGRSPEELPFVASTRLAFVELAVDYDRRDTPLAPMAGGAFRASVARAAPALGSDISYVRVRAEITGYLPIVPGRLSLATRLGTGAVRPAQGDELPPAARFLAGGGTTVRGFATGTAGPRVRAATCPREPCRLLPIGGTAVLLASVELRGWLPSGFGAALFADAGRAWAWGFGSLADLVVGVGGGLRYLTPLGPLRLDVGVPVVRDPPLEGAPARPFQIHLGLGEAF